MVVVIGVWLVTTTSRLARWGSELALWQEAVIHSPQKPRPWINWGGQLARAGHDRLARDAYARAMVLASDPQRARIEGPMRGRHVAMLNLAILQAKTGQYDEALALTAQIHPRRDGRASLVNRLETQWRAEREHGGPSLAF